MSEDTNRLLVQVNQKLDKLILLSAVDLANNKEMDQKTKVALLTKAGFTSHEIGIILQLRAESVRRLRSRAKR